MSIEDLENEVEKIQDEREKLEEICDTLPQCQEEDGCKNCGTYKKIAEIDDKIEALEEKIEAILGEYEEND
ncbi:MAG: hypothetical protein ACTSRI_03320 [Promethearchaeota archaeon]